MAFEKFEEIIDKKKVLYKELDLQISNFISESESSEYYAHAYLLGDKSVRFRIGKKTSIKAGWFVTIWKRSNDGITIPYDFSDNVDYLVIGIVESHKMGIFIFSKAILLEKNIFSNNNKGGKRGFRLYAPWSKVKSVQSMKSKAWQEKYFIDFDSKQFESGTQLKKLLCL